MRGVTQTGAISIPGAVRRYTCVLVPARPPSAMSEDRSAPVCPLIERRLIGAAGNREVFGVICSSRWLRVCSASAPRGLSSRRSPPKSGPRLLSSALLCPPSALIECTAQHAQRRREVTHDELGPQPDNAIAGARELPITAQIGGNATRVTTAIDLDDEPQRRRIEVRDEPKQRHLPPKRDPELAGAQRAPKQGLRLRGRLPHCVSVKSEIGFVVRHARLPSPAGDRTKPSRAGAVTRARGGSALTECMVNDGAAARSRGAARARLA